MAAAHSSLSWLFFTGRRVRLTPKGTAKLLVPVTVLYGIVLKLIECPGNAPRIIVEFETSTGAIVSGIYAVEDLETLPLIDAQLKQDLIGRKVHFPRSSGIGIPFPPEATDYGTISNAYWAGGHITLVVWVPQDGKKAGVDFVTTADFTQCDLIMRVAKPDTG